METYRSIIDGDLEERLLAPPWPQISEGAKDCIRQMLTRDQHLRPNAREMLKHQFLQDHKFAPREPIDNAVLKKMMKFAKSNKLKR